MSAFFIFEIKHVKNDKIFNILNDRFSAMSGSMGMIFGVFSETNVRLLKNICNIRNYSQNIPKVITYSMSKVA